MSHSPHHVFFRLFAAPGRDLRRLEPKHVADAESQELLRERRVEPSSAADGSYLDVTVDWQQRAQRPLVRVENLFFFASEWFTSIFCRTHAGFHASDLDVDGISQLSVACDRFNPDAWRMCRYGFDCVEARLRSQEGLAAPWGQHQDRWRLRVTGSYLAYDTAPYCWDPSLSPQRDATAHGATERAEPCDVLALLAGKPVQQLEWFWRGRVVHRSFHREGTFVEPPRGGLWHTCLDGWDNCLDARFLEEMKQCERARPAEVYARDRAVPGHELPSGGR